uniref:Uncharacterized protein n=1 Tax=Panagrolaimus sp. ES5 TaxID=591445 RepID=A0AC34F6E6_9BILA
MGIIIRNEILPGHESKIEVLKLCSNLIERVEDEAFDKFASLKILDLESNRLTLISDKILTQKLGLSLMKLNLASNDLHNLSITVFQHLTKLESLNLRFNERINLVSEINGKNVSIFPEALSNLKTLNLESCNIQNFDENVFINLRSLKKLDISQNPITTVPKALKKLPNLEYLKIMFSEIATINDCDFCGLLNLKTLHLKSSYHLSYINENAFGAFTNKSTVPQLKEFSLNTGRLSILPEKLLNWKNISRIDIFGTSFTCNCSMAWLINDYNSSNPLVVVNLIDEWNHSYKNELECNSPRALAGKRLFKLTADDFCRINLDDTKNKDVTTLKPENLQLILFILSIIFISVLFTCIGIYYYRNRKIMHIREKCEAKEEDLL